MRISKGILKGLYLKPIRGIRPTQDKVKNAIFDILQDSIEGVKFLELFAGSGIVGLEALSRGAAEVVLVENNPHCVRFIKESISKIGPRIKGKNIQVYKQDAIKAIEQLHAKGRKFDIVFADPPYYKGSYERNQKRRNEQVIGAKKTLQTLGCCDIISTSGLAIIQAQRGEILEKTYATLVLMRSYEYGDTVLKVYERSNG